MSLPPSTRRQNAALTTATGADPRCESSRRKNRPSDGVAPSTRKKSADTFAVSTCAASPAVITARRAVAYRAIAEKLREKGLKTKAGKLPVVTARASSHHRAIVPPERTRYLAEIAETLRGYHQRVAKQATVARERQSLTLARGLTRRGCAR